MGRLVDINEFVASARDRYIGYIWLVFLPPHSFRKLHQLTLLHSTWCPSRRARIGHCGIYRGKLSGRDPLYLIDLQLLYNVLFCYLYDETIDPTHVQPTILREQDVPLADLRPVWGSCGILDWVHCGRLAELHPP